MSKFEFIENETTQLTDEQKEALTDLIDISDQIKRSIGLRFSPMQINGSTIRFNGIAANVKYKDIELIVRPKVINNAISSKEQMRTLYLRILKTSRANLNSVVYFTSMSSAIMDDETFIDCIAEYFYEKLAYVMKKLPIVVYYQKEEKRISIKGKVLIQKELKTPLKDGKTWCRYKYLSKDNQYNALLKWCCSYFSARVSSRSLKRKLNKLIEDLEGDIALLTKEIVKTSRLPRNYDIYKDPYKVAKDIFLYSKATTTFRQSNDICGYVINMETAFQNIVCYYTNRVSIEKKLFHVPQADILLASSDRDDDLDYHIRPDDLLVKGENKLILDAKYKNISVGEKPSREDFYQMLASCVAHNTHEAMLIYPQGDTNGYTGGNWKIVNPLNGEHCKIYAEGIDIFSDDQTIITQLNDVIMKSDFSEEC